MQERKRDALAHGNSSRLRRHIHHQCTFLPIFLFCSAGSSAAAKGSCAALSPDKKGAWFLDVFSGWCMSRTGGGAYVPLPGQEAAPGATLPAHVGTTTEDRRFESSTEPSFA